MTVIIYFIAHKDIIVIHEVENCNFKKDEHTENKEVILDIFPSKVSRYLSERGGKICHFALKIGEKIKWMIYTSYLAALRSFKSHVFLVIHNNKLISTVP